MKKLIVFFTSIGIFLVNPIITNAEFSEDFSGGLTNWYLVVYDSAGGSSNDPPPKIDSSMGLPSPSLDVNGDSWCGNGTYSKTTFNYTNELTIEWDMYVASGYDWNWGRGGLSSHIPNLEKPRSDGTYIDGDRCGTEHLARITLNDDGLWNRRPANLVISIIAEDGTTNTYVEDNAEYLLNNWHHYRIYIKKNGYVDFFVDENLKWTSTKKIDNTRGELPILFGDRDQYGPVRIDNILVNDAASDPGKATLISPSGKITENNPTYTWNAVASSTWYYLWVNDETGNMIKKWYTADDADCGNGTGRCSVTPTTELADGSCKWWIQTWNEYGYGPWSAGMTFKVDTGIDVPPGKATLISPIGTITKDNPNYTWSAVKSATWYYLWVNDETGNMIKKWYRADDADCGNGTGECSVTPTTELADGTCKWWIQTWNDYGYGPWSDEMAFTVDTGIDVPPEKATLISPSGKTTDNNPTYTWNAVANSTWYYLWVNDRKGNQIEKWYTADDANCGDGTGECSVTPATELSDGSCKWWIQTWNSSGYGPWSDGMSFTVITPSCTNIAGDWAGNWAETSCDSFNYSGSWTGTVTSGCTFTGTDNWDHVSGTIDPNTMRITANGISKDGCGFINVTGTFISNSVSGSYSYSAGGGGTFSGSKLADHTNDTIIGTWNRSIWYWDVAAAEWTKMTASPPDWRHISGRFHR